MLSRPIKSWIAVCAAALLVACSKDTTQPDAGSPDSGQPDSGSLDSGLCCITPNTQGWWRDKVFYEVFVRSFQDSSGDGVGDLAGLTAHLDALNDGDAGTGNDLEVDALWLMPIHPSPSYHGYDVTDYRGVNPAYGTLADLDALLAAAHRRGMRVILDIVLNHSSNQHPWFLDSQSSSSAAKRDWYLWRPDDPGWLQPFGNGRTWWPLNGAYYYGVFWSGMPDLNLTNPDVETELVTTMKFWLARGVDGFRLDAIRYYIETGGGQGQQDTQPTHDFITRVRAKLQADYPDALLVGEAWGPVEVQTAYYGNGDEVQLAFSFDLAAAIKSSVGSGNADNIINTLAVLDAALQGKDRGYDAPFLSNHDQIRVMRVLGGDAGAARVAAAVLFSLPGTPFIYYGEELGMQGGAGADDTNKRTPYRWDPSGTGFSSGTPWYDVGEAPGVDLQTERADPGSLWSLYRSLIRVRHSQTPLARGGGSYVLFPGRPTSVLTLVREDAGKKVLFVANVAATAVGAFTVPVSGTPTVLLSEGLASPPTGNGTSISVPGLAGRGFAFLSL